MEVSAEVAAAVLVILASFEEGGVEGGAAEGGEGLEREVTVPDNEEDPTGAGGSEGTTVDEGGTADTRGATVGCAGGGREVECPIEDEYDVAGAGAAVGAEEDIAAAGGGTHPLPGNG